MIRKVLLIFATVSCLFFNSVVSAQPNVEGVIVDIRKYLTTDYNAETFPVDLGNYLHLNQSIKLDIHEALRYAAITNEQYREKIIDLMLKSGLISQKDVYIINQQISKYHEIINKFKDITRDIDVEQSYNGFSCTGLDDFLYTPKGLNQFNRNLKITDVSAHQDFLRFFGDNNIFIFHVPSYPALLDYVKLKSKVRFIGLEEKLIYNNGTATSMFKKVQANGKTYFMFPQQIFTIQHNGLADLTAKEYAFIALNLSLTNSLNDGTFQTYYKIYRRNASLCLYSSRT